VRHTLLDSTALDPVSVCGTVSVWNGECVEQWNRNGMLKWRTDKPSEDVICVVTLEILLLCCFATQSVGGPDYVDVPPYV